MLTSLSPEGPPASHVGPVQGHREQLLSSGGHRGELDRKYLQDVLGGEGYLEAGSLVGRWGHVGLGSACLERWMDVVPWGPEYHVAEASVQSDEAEEDGNVAAGDPEDLQHVLGPAWEEMCVHWWAEVQTPLQLAQAKACQDAHWLVVEVHEEEVHLEEEDHEVLVGDGMGLVVEVYKDQEEADGHGVQEGGSGHGVQGQVEVPGQWGLASP